MPTYPESFLSDLNKDALADEFFDALLKIENDPINSYNKFYELSKRNSMMSMLYLAEAKELNNLPEHINIDVYKMYKNAAELGSIEAKYRIAYDLFHQNKYIECIEILEFLDKQNFSPAQFCLGSFFYIGTGVEKNLDRAILIWKSAENNGNILAKKALAEMQIRGEMGLSNIGSGILKFINMVIVGLKLYFIYPNSDRLRAW